MLNFELIMVFSSFKIKNSKLKIIFKPDAVIGQKGRICKGLDLRVELEASYAR